jgi:hypothetical protein
MRMKREPKTAPPAGICAPTNDVRGTGEVAGASRLPSRLSVHYETPQRRPLRLNRTPICRRLHSAKTMEPMPRPGTHSPSCVNAPLGWSVSMPYSSFTPSGELATTTLKT